MAGALPFHQNSTADPEAARAPKSRQATRAGAWQFRVGIQMDHTTKNHELDKTWRSLCFSKEFFQRGLWGIEVSLTFPSEGLSLEKSKTAIEDTGGEVLMLYSMFPRCPGFDLVGRGVLAPPRQKQKLPAKAFSDHPRQNSSSVLVPTSEARSP